MVYIYIYIYIYNSNHQSSIAILSLGVYDTKPGYELGIICFTNFDSID